MFGRPESVAADPRRAIGVTAITSTITAAATAAIINARLATRLRANR
jgi:hypothetical protein